MMQPDGKYLESLFDIDVHFLQRYVSIPCKLQEYR